jgi:hypothetical protein
LWMKTTNFVNYLAILLRWWEICWAFISLIFWLWYKSVGFYSSQYFAVDGTNVIPGIKIFLLSCWQPSAELLHPMIVLWSLYCHWLHLFCYNLTYNFFCSTCK